MKIVVKRVTEETLDSYFEVFSNILRTHFPEYSKKAIEFFLTKPWSKKRYKKLLKDKDRLLLGAWVDNELVGILDAEMLVGGVSFCVWLMVDPLFQGKGIGRRLLGFWENLAKKNGIHSFHLYADERNLPYYKKLGFDVIGLWKKSFFGTDEYILAKLIQEPKEKNFLK